MNKTRTMTVVITTLLALGVGATDSIDARCVKCVDPPGPALPSCPLQPTYVSGGDSCILIDDYCEEVGDCQGFGPNPNEPPAPPPPDDDEDEGPDEDDDEGCDSTDSCSNEQVEQK